MPKITSQGQITIPSDVQKILNIDSHNSQDLYFKFEEARRIVWISSTQVSYPTAIVSISSKGQITIPKKIRELLRLTPGIDNILFHIVENNVYFEKELEVVPCQICQGEGKFKEHPCLVCRSSGSIKREAVMDELSRLLFVARKYQVSIQIKTESLNIPEAKFFSSNYPSDVLDVFQDYYQMRLIENFAPKSLQQPDKFMHPTDIVLEEILSLLKTNKAKEIVQRWFRGEGNVFSLSNT
ncbi:hypothetical protein P9597_09450 [Aneurinibacillus migulanus]|uniref:hypothetical protein n=1 Tax=Aneurinibacillus migulanus TaxID=47500 RepID=UPI002E2179B7|nr:hypothetical protein [Aneurinibacillus migulanus]